APTPNTTVYLITEATTLDHAHTAAAEAAKKDKPDEPAHGNSDSEGEGEPVEPADGDAENDPVEPADGDGDGEGDPGEPADGDGEGDPVAPSAQLRPGPVGEQASDVEQAQAETGELDDGKGQTGVPDDHATKAGNGASTAEVRPEPAGEPAVEPKPVPKAALLFGAGLIPAAGLHPLLGNARIREIIHPGNSPAEPRYIPSRTLAEFIRCRDLTCRFPHCDIPATT
ncbi:hypothetical protein ACQI46_25600, partial [Mycobacterium sp. SMC-4]